MKEIYIWNTYKVRKKTKDLLEGIKIEIIVTLIGLWGFNLNCHERFDEKDNFIIKVLQLLSKHTEI